MSSVARRPPRRRVEGRRRRLAPGVVALVCGLALDAAWGAATTSRAAELERIRLEIERLERRLGTVATQHGDQRERLERLGLEVALQEERVAEVRAERRLVEERLTELGESIGRLEAGLEASRGRLQRGLGTLYRLGGGGVWRSLLTASTPAGSLEARRTLRYLSWRQAQRVEEFRRDRRELAAHRDERLEQRGRVARLLERQTTRLDRLDTLREQQAGVVAELEREAAELERRTAELVARQERFTELLSFLAGERTQTSDEVPMQRFKGLLDWPLEGEVVERFGPRRDPRYRTLVPHNGVSLDATSDGEVRSIFPGLVVFAEDFEGFGITVVVLHAGRVFTLYSGLASTRVVAQDVVSSGQALGRAASRLYFEVRVEDRPEDPLEWLR